MSLLRSIGLHLGLTAAAGTAALALWTREEEPVQAAAAEVVVWAGNPDQIESIAFESKDSKVKLTPKKDELGRWYVVDLNKVDKGEPEPENPHAPPSEEPKSSPKKPGEWVRSKFVSVKEGNLLAETLAPLKALRAIGRIDKDRDEEFGFDKPEGKMSVKLAGTLHELSVGGQTPGGGDRYVRLLGSNEAYAVPGEALRGLLFPDSRLLETQLHGFEPSDATRLKLSEGAHSRELVRVEGKPDAWADVKNPRQQDETASNWMTKVLRLRVSRYLEDKPKDLTQDSLVVRLEYSDAKKTLGFMELFKVAGPPGEKPADTYLVRTENTRWYAEVLASRAEQIASDLSSVLTQPSK